LSDGVGPTGWEPIPDGLTLADGINLSLADPAYVGEPGTPRRCIAARPERQDGRCAMRAMRAGLVCSAHAGLLDSAAGGRARAEKRRLAVLAAEDRVAERSLGVRAALSAQLQREQAKIEQAVQHLIDVASAGDTKAAMALLPWLDQALGKPMPLEQQSGSSTGDLAHLSSEELAEIVAAGRRARLKEAG
jgi:hypothetical protein